MTFNATITISIILAICALFAPSITAVINNRHAEKMKRLDLEHEAKIKQFEIYYADKKTAFTDLINAAGKLTSWRRSTDAYARLLSAINTAALFCNHSNQLMLHGFIKTVDSFVEPLKCDPEVFSTYTNAVNSMAEALSEELESTKPDYS